MRIRENETFTVIHYAKMSREKREALWQEARAHSIGGSEVATILGLNKYKTVAALWAEKTGRIQPEDISNKWPIVKGNVLEDTLRRRFSSLHPELQVQSGSNYTFVSREHSFMHANLDGIIRDNDGIFGLLEIKTANAIRGRLDWHDEDGNLTIPAYYLTQVTHYMTVTGFTYGYFYADIGENEPIEIRFERNKDDIKAVTEACVDFWQYVETDTLPELTTAADVSFAYPHDDGEIVAADSSESITELNKLAQAYKTAQDAEKAAKAHTDALKDRLAALIGKHEGISTDTWKVTYKTTVRAARDIPAKRVPESSYRIMRVKQL